MTAGEFNAILDTCSIDDKGCKYLVNGLYKCLDTSHTMDKTLLTFEMDHNAISCHGVHHFSTLLKIGCIKVLNVSNHHNKFVGTDIGNGVSLIGMTYWI